jgi:UDP-GlcNAc:undecaprenyl-phosphate GlcNAc-1-phosphate transferase
VLLVYLWAGLLAFGAVSVTLFDNAGVFWIVGFGLLLAVLVSVIPRLKSRNQGVPR